MFSPRLLLDILLPQRCIQCSAYGERLCLMCISQIPPAPKTEAQWIHALCSYKYPALKKALWELKYRERTSLADPLGRMIADYLLEDLSDRILWGKPENIVLIPVPLSRKRKRERGYNHTALLARAVQKSIRNAAEASEGAVIKTKETLPQMEAKNRTERLKNLRGAFEVARPEQVHGKTIVLIDDITTTGATLREIRKVLKKAGAKDVLAVVVAH